MNRRKIVYGLLLATAASLMLTQASPAADDLESLQSRFKQRYAQLLKLKQAGKIGETWKGFLEPVEGRELEAAADQLVQDENDDRRKLYRLIAEKEKATPDLVAERNATRNFEKARPGEYLKGRDGQWKQKS